MNQALDIRNKLEKLTHEILNFGDAISHTENPANADLRYACELFSEYLDYQLQVINSDFRFKDMRTDVQQTTDLLYQLSQLITPKNDTIDGTVQWPVKLHDFFSQIQTLKKMAA